MGGVIRSEAEYFLDEDAVIPHLNLNPQAQVPGTGVVNHIPKADYLRWTLGYDRFFFFRPLNPSNSFVLVTSWNGQWNVTASRDPRLDFRNPLVKPGKAVTGPLGQTQPDTNWEDQKVSGAGGLHPRALPEPYVSLSTHTAPIIQPSASLPGAASGRTRWAGDVLRVPTRRLPAGDAP